MNRPAILDSWHKQSLVINHLQVIACVLLLAGCTDNTNAEWQTDDRVRRESYNLCVTYRYARNANLEGCEGAAISVAQRCVARCEGVPAEFRMKP
jgi:hypothetical protein